MFTWSWERPGCEWANTWGSPSDLPVRQGALQKTAEWRDAPSAPEGIQATTGLLCSFRQWIALLEGVADCEWLLESLRDQSQWLSESCSSCVCEKNECPDASLSPGSSATWAMILFRFVEIIVNKHRLGWDILLTLNKSRFFPLASKLHRLKSNQLSRHWSEKVKPFF